MASRQLLVLCHKHRLFKRQLVCRESHDEDEQIARCRANSCEFAWTRQETTR